MKKLFFFFLTTVICSSIVLGGEWYVSPLGNDSNSGSKEKPFATIAKASSAVRIAKQKTNNERHVVHLAAGTFELTEPLRFESEDSGTAENPVSYVGEGNQTVVSGGLTISQQGDLNALTGWRDEGNGVWIADIPQVNGQPLYFEQLFVNGRRAVRSRYPNAGFFKPKEIRQGVPITQKDPKPTFTEQSIVGNADDLGFLKNISKGELRFAQFIVHHHWDVTKRIPLAFDAEQNLLKMQGEPMKHWNPWRNTSLYYFENVRAGFDVTGEWFYDGVNRKIYYRPLPNETIAASKFVVPRNGMSQLLLIHGKKEAAVHNIRFEKITFAETDSSRRINVMQKANLPQEITGDLKLSGPIQIDPQQAAFWADAAIDVDTARNISFIDCELNNIGEYGIWLKNSHGCRIKHCALTNLGAGGIRIGGVGKTTGNVVDNCIIQRGGRLYACAVAVWIGNNTEDNHVTHNDIGDFYYTGISAGWTWGYQGGVAFRNVIEFNRIHDIGQGAMADMGGVYTLGTSHGTRVCNNVIFNVKSYAYGGWGLYTDEGSEGILMENNLVYDTTDGSFHQHYGKNNVIRNNILAFSRPHQIAVTRVEPHRSLTFENNIIYWDQGNAIGYRAEQARVDYGSNLWWNVTGNVQFKNKTHKDWLEMGKDVGGIVADPKFVNVAQRDFRLHENSPAKEINFVPFDFSQAGVYGDDTWIQRAKEK
ncbi:MAG: right-handed parallel beta-helix repeat-containing protein [Planctomycetaceae bacterium]|jgi:hypothetical protein|nr:right-handed parallel beta-helix repeat-containing protein [Planctomycetaceae bacterium]